MALTICKECGESISKKATKCPKCGSPAKKKTSLFTWLVVGIIVLFAGGYFSSDPGSSAGSGAGSQRETSPKTLARANVELEFTWKKVGFDNVMEANFKIINKSDYPIRDIQVRCTHYAKSGTKIDSNRATIYDVVPANSTKTFEDFNMGFIHTQAQSTSCVLVDFTL